MTDKADYSLTMMAEGTVSLPICLLIYKHVHKNPALPRNNSSERSFGSSICLKKYVSQSNKVHAKNE